MTTEARLAALESAVLYLLRRADEAPDRSTPKSMLRAIHHLVVAGEDLLAALRSGRQDASQ